MSSVFTAYRQTDSLMMPFLFKKVRSGHCRHDLSPIECRLTSDSTKQSWLCSSFYRSAGGDFAARKLTKQRPGKLVQTPTSLRAREECHIPHPVLALFVYLAQQGVGVSDLFRRPGNISQMKQILQYFTAGQSINWEDYNVYTVANVAKKLLLSIPGGLFGVAGETELLATSQAMSCASELAQLSAWCSPKQREQPSSLHTTDQTHLTSLTEHKSVKFAADPGARYVEPTSLSWPRTAVQHLNKWSELTQMRIGVFLKVLDTLPASHQQVTILIFGILHQLVFFSASTSTKSLLTSLVRTTRPTAPVLQTTTPNSNPEATNDTVPSTDIPLLTLAEGVVKSVAGALFHTCCSSVSRVEQAAQVLRSLVIYFPTMGDSVTRFYSNTVTYSPLLSSPCSTTFSLPTSRATTVGRAAVNKPICVLCPKSDHSTCFDQTVLYDNHTRVCPINLIQAASRLFCLSADPETTSSPSKPIAVDTNAAWTTTKRYVRKACSRKPDVGATVRGSVQTSVVPSNPVVSISAPLPRDGSSSTPTEVVPHCDVKQLNKQLNAQATVTQSIPHTVSNTNKSNHTFDLHSECYVPTIRRHLSRYRSLRRRQMENLSRRAEWFLGPTIMPVVTLHPRIGCDIPTEPRRYSTDTCCADTMELVVISTVSLIDLGDATVSGDSHGGASTASHRLPVLQPRLLFTASTGELEQEDYCDSAVQCKSATICRSDSSRQRLLSVGSYMESTAAGSFVSVHSAPSPGWCQSHNVEHLGCYQPTRSSCCKQSPTIPTTLDNGPEQPYSTLLPPRSFSGDDGTSVTVRKNPIQTQPISEAGSITRTGCCLLNSTDTWRERANHPSAFELDVRRRRSSASASLQSSDVVTVTETVEPLHTGDVIHDS